MSNTFEHVKVAPQPRLPERPINGLQLYTDKIQLFMDNPENRQMIARDITTSFLEHPETLIDFTQAFQTARTTDKGRHKGKDFETLDKCVVDEMQRYPRTHFQEIVDKPQRLLPLIRTMTDVDNPVDPSFTEKDYLKLDPKRKARLFSTYFFTSLFQQAEYFPKQKGNEQMSMNNMMLVQKKIVDLFYALAQNVVYDDEPGQRTRTQTFFIAAIDNIIPHMMAMESHTAGLLHTAAFSTDNDIVAKAALINVTAQIIDATRQMNRFGGIQQAVQEENGVARKYLTETQHQDPQRQAKLRYIDKHFRVHIVQTNKEAPDDTFYLSEDIDPLERHIFEYDPGVWYAFAHMYSKNSSAGCVPITFPSGIWKGIGHGDGNNTERTYRLLQKTWGEADGERFVRHNQAVQDAMLHLLPLMETSQTEMNRISTSVTLNQDAKHIMPTGSIPLDLAIGQKLVHVQLATNGKFYFQNGEPIVIPEDQEQQWKSFIVKAIRPQIMDYIAQGVDTITPEIVPFILQYITPELLGTTFIGVERDLRIIKDELTHPRRGILEQGITVKIKKGQLPEGIPIESIHFNQAASEAEVKLGKTKLKIGINMTKPPPSITTINGIDIPSGDTKVWLEYVILSPLRAITCPDLSKINTGADDSILLADLESMSIKEAARKTIEVLHKSVGHMFRLGYKANGEPKKPTEEQIKRVMLVVFPLPGMKQLNLAKYNELSLGQGDTQVRTAETDPYWDYAIYKEETYQRHQKIKSAEVVAPHAYDTLSKLLAGEKH